MSANQRLAVLIAATIAIFALMTACGSKGDKATEKYQDAPRSGVDNGPGLVVTMPDGFNNVATKCIQGTGIRLAVIFHNNGGYGSVALVADPTCKP